MIFEVMSRQLLVNFLRSERSTQAVSGCCKNVIDRDMSFFAMDANPHQPISQSAPEHSTHHHAIEDIHLADDTSARTPRLYSSISKEGKSAAAKFHYRYDSLSRVMYECIWIIDQA